MDELDLLGSVRADVPDLDPFAQRRIRNRLLTEAAGTAATGPTAVATGPTAVATGATATATGGGLPRGPDLPRRGPAGWRLRTRVGVAAAAVVAVLGTGIAVTGVRSGDGTLVGATAAAAEVLNRAADAALRAEPAPVPKAGQVLYRREIGGQPAGTMGGTSSTGSAAHLCGSVHETWMPVDPAAHAYVRRTDGILPRATGDPTRLPRDPQCEYGSFVEDVGPAGGSGTDDPKELAALPTDPRALYTHMRQAAQGRGSGPDDETLVLLTDVARTASPYLTPRLSAALYRAMTYVPGVELIGRTTDLLGRTGTAIGRTDAGRGVRQEVLFEPGTGRMLGERQTVTDPGRAFDGEQSGLRAGDVLWQSVITVSIVARVKQLPAG